MVLMIAVGYHQNQPSAVLVSSPLHTEEKLSHFQQKHTSFVYKASGERWRLWRNAKSSHTTGAAGAKPIEELENLSCDWVTYLPNTTYSEILTSNNNNQHKTEAPPEIKMCLHAENDNFVSHDIREKGRWAECDELTRLWSKYHQHAQQDGAASSGIYIDIGANIGSCVMQMLLTTNATIVAFEPHPRNLFCLTSTLSKMDNSYSDRVFVFPIALGNQTAEATINAAKGNLGNSVVGKKIKDYFLKEQAFYDPIDIRVERLDDILRIGGDDEQGEVSLLKLDAQGFECYIIDGMVELLKRTRAIKTEVTDHFLSSFDGCSDEIMLDKLRRQDFDIFLDGVLVPGHPPKKVGSDMVAVKRESSS